jgi:deoxycytidine triphosphate deaminase
MSIKSDKWIRRMVEQQAMIEPFAPQLVRENESGKIVSYGTSSYGYDVRCANEFKIFTNINSTIVDPKHFDSRWSSRTPRRCRRASTPTKVWRRCCSSSRTRFAKPRTVIVAASTRVSAV